MKCLLETARRIQVGRPRTYGSLTVFPLGGLPRRKPDYTVLDDALAAGTARITEIGAGGRVPEVDLENSGDRPVLLVDGEEIGGAKQNRIVNLTLLAPAGVTTRIPVSCVEAGRWAAQSTTFGSTPQVMFSEGRRDKYRDVSKSMHVGQRTSNQARVWKNVDELACSMHVTSPTSKMSDVYDGRRDDVESFVRALPHDDGQFGAIFALAGKIRCVEWFDSTETLARLWGKLVRSWAMDAIRRPDRRHTVPSLDEARAFVERVGRAEVRAHAAVGVGEDLRFERDGLSGGALRVDDRLVHVCVFDGDGGETNDGPRAYRSMAPASRRRRA